MKTILVNYANDRFERVRSINSWTGKWIAHFDKIFEYGPQDIDDQFKKKYDHILSQRRGNGLWLWKPYFVLKTLETMEDNDILFYLDSGAFFVRDIRTVVEQMNDDIFVNELPLVEYQWTKQSVIQTVSKDAYYNANSNQILATYFIIRKTNYSMKFVKNWLDLCCREELINPHSSERDDCISHREDQSLLSLLCKNENIKPHRDFSQYGRFPDGYYKKGYVFNVKNYNDCYKPIVASHRLDHFYFNTFCKIWLECCLPVNLAKKVHTYKRRKFRNDNC